MMSDCEELDGGYLEDQSLINPITIVGTEIGKIVKNLNARSYSAMLLILLGQVGKNSFGLTGTMRTLNYFNTVKLNPSTIHQMPLEP